MTGQDKLNDYRKADTEFLLERGAELEDELLQRGERLKSLEDFIKSNNPNIKKAGLKLGLAGAAGLGGLAAAPFTGGLSIAVTMVSMGLLLWDAAEYTGELRDFLPQYRMARRLRAETEVLTDELRMIGRELDRRAKDRSRRGNE